MSPEAEAAGWRAGGQPGLHKGDRISKSSIYAVLFTEGGLSGNPEGCKGKTPRTSEAQLRSPGSRAPPPAQDVSFPSSTAVPTRGIDVRLPPRQEESGTSQVHVSGSSRVVASSAGVSMATPRPPRCEGSAVRLGYLRSNGQRLPSSFKSESPHSGVWIFKFL